MPDRYTITPRTRATIAAYGHVWPGEGRTVTAAEVGIDVLQRADADPRFDVERLPDDAAPAAPAPAAKPKPSPPRRRKG